MDRDSALGILGGLSGAGGVIILMVFSVLHLAVTLGMTDISYCGVRPNYYPLLNFLWPFTAWLVLVILSAIFDESPVPVAIIGALAVAAFFLVIEIWFVVEHVSAKETAKEMRRGFGGTLELSRQLFHDSTFCRFMDTIF